MEITNPKSKKPWGFGLVILVPLAAIGLIFAVVVLSRVVYRVLNPNLDIEVSGPVTLTSDWLEIEPREPLRLERQVQYLYIHTVQPFTPDSPSWGIRFPDGSVIVPEVQLVDANGTTYKLEASSFSLTERNRTDSISGIGFSSRDLPREKAYRMVRIRSDRPIKLSKIIWRNYNQWDRQ